MKRKKIEEQLINIGIELNKLESLSRILLNCIRCDDNLKKRDIESLSSVLSQKIISTKQKFNDAEKILKR